MKSNAMKDPYLADIKSKIVDPIGKTGLEETLHS